LSLTPEQLAFENFLVLAANITHPEIGFCLFSPVFVRPGKEPLYPCSFMCLFTPGLLAGPYPSDPSVWPAPFPRAIAPMVKPTKAAAIAAATFASTDNFICPPILDFAPTDRASFNLPKRRLCYMVRLTTAKRTFVYPRLTVTLDTDECRYADKLLRQTAFDDCGRPAVATKNLCGSRRSVNILPCTKAELLFG